jgi:hypothetical protein
VTRSMPTMQDRSAERLGSSAGDGIVGGSRDPGPLGRPSGNGVDHLKHNMKRAYPTGLVSAPLRESWGYGCLTKFGSRLPVGPPVHRRDTEVRAAPRGLFYWTAEPLTGVRRSAISFARWRIHSSTPRRPANCRGFTRSYRWPHSAPLRRCAPTDITRCRVRLCKRSSWRKQTFGIS